VHNPPSGFQHFLSRVHRRYVFVRVLERMGLGVLGGCAAALPLLAILLWRGLPAISLTLAAVVAGALTGIFWGLIARPNLMAAAMEADRQLGWSDLLSSAIAVRGTASVDSWAAAVMAEADLRSRGVSPASVVLNRLGARAWGGIGLATALIVVLGLIPTYPTSTQAGDTSSARATTLIAPDGAESRSLPQSRGDRRHTLDEQEPEDRARNRMNEAELATKSQGDKALGPSGDNSHHQATAADPNGHGTGASQSHVSNNPRSALSDAATHARASSGGVPAAGGVGESSANHYTGGAASGNAAGAPSRSAQVPPWQSSDWPANAQRAGHAIDSGEIPDSYRDVVREYFDRP
jgi:hypothetical protein